MSNIAQDMIINHIIWEDISHNFVEIPKSEDGKNMALFVPKEYTGKLIFEELYEWLKDEKEKYDKEKKKQEQQGGGLKNSCRLGSTCRGVNYKKKEPINGSF
jgi:hypothetical protein